MALLGRYLWIGGAPEATALLKALYVVAIVNLFRGV